MASKLRCKALSRFQSSISRPVFPFFNSVMLTSTHSMMAFWMSRIPSVMGTSNSMTSALRRPSSDFATVTWKRGYSEGRLRKRLRIMVARGAKPEAKDAHNESFQRCCSDAFGVEDNEAGDFGRVEVLGQEIDDQDTRCDGEDTTLPVHFFSLSNVCQVGVDQAQSTAFGRVADGGVFCQSLSNPAILSVVCSDYDNQIVSGGIVRV
ncbi:DNA repair protein, partial [Aureobasidium melanogenum]